MSDQYLGSTVSIKCVDDLGVYQGQIVGLSDACVTLAKPFCNGVPYVTSRGGAQVTIKAKDILNIDIISTPEGKTVDKNVSGHGKTVVVRKPVAKRAGRSVSESSPHHNAQCLTKKLPELHLQEAPINGKINSQARNSRKKLNEKDEQAFGTSIDHSLQQDFDFEKNLALFNKEAVWQEINSRKPEVVRQSENNRSSKDKYRHDENVIKSEPTILRQIQVPGVYQKQPQKEYVTDDGLVIPSISLDLQRQLIGAADRFGISWERRVELLGRAGTEIALQLLGGAHRLNPNNAHQWPTIVALCGPHRSGAAGINCARQLSTHGVKTVVYVENSDDISLLQELSLYKLTGNKVETNVNNLPAVADLVLLALCEEKSPRQISQAANWANNSRGSILAIEPPSSGTPGITSKFSLLSGLPLSHSVENGRLYLCNLALPNKVFLDVGISYRSPFGPKFVIPLHLNSSS